MNCTVVGNAAEISGGGTYKSELFVLQPDMNCVVYGNSAPTYPEMNHTAMATNSCSPALISGVNGNINADPLFINSAAGDYRLLATSPCVDAGMNEVVFSSVDLAGNSRIIDGDLDGRPVVDMGAYEFPVISVDIDVKPGTDINPINLRSGGYTLIAILTTEGFNAARVDHRSVRAAGAAPVIACRWDADWDRDKDLILLFRTRDFSITPDSTSLSLVGQTHAGQLIHGQDTIKIVPPQKRKPWRNSHGNRAEPRG